MASGNIFRHAIVCQGDRNLLGPRFLKPCNMHATRLMAFTLTYSIFSLLPDTLITCQKYCRFIGMYREVIANTYCKDDTMYTGR